jgi:hypothetical protein
MYSTEAMGAAATQYSVLYFAVEEIMAWPPELGNTTDAACSSTSRRVGVLAHASPQHSAGGLLERHVIGHPSVLYYGVHGATSAFITSNYYAGRQTLSLPQSEPSAFM